MLVRRWVRSGERSVLPTRCIRVARSDTTARHHGSNRPNPPHVSAKRQRLGNQAAEPRDLMELCQRAIDFLTGTGFVSTE